MLIQKLPYAAGAFPTCWLRYIWRILTFVEGFDKEAESGSGFR